MRKLKLNRQTIRTLSSRELQGAAGGVPTSTEPPSITTDCPLPTHGSCNSCVSRFCPGSEACTTTLITF